MFHLDLLLCFYLTLVHPGLDRIIDIWNPINDLVRLERTGVYAFFYQL